MKKKLPDVPNARFWSIATRADETRCPAIVILECERYADARAVALRVLGVPYVDVAELDAKTMRKLPARVQVRWVGSAASRVPDLRVQTRSINASGRATPWADLR